MKLNYYTKKEFSNDNEGKLFLQHYKERLKTQNVKHNITETGDGRIIVEEWYDLSVKVEEGED